MAQSYAVENISTGSRGFADRFTVAACILNEAGALARAKGERFKNVRYILQRHELQLRIELYLPFCISKCFSN